jgi:hypothetical protein
LIWDRFDLLPCLKLKIRTWFSPSFIVGLTFEHWIKLLVNCVYLIPNQIIVLLCCLFNLIISSPGPNLKVHVNYCHHLASVVCKLFTFQASSPTPLGQLYFETFNSLQRQKSGTVIYRYIIEEIEFDLYIVKISHHTDTTGPIGTKLSRNVPWMVLYKVSVFHSSRIFNMAARANNMLWLAEISVQVVSEKKHFETFFP